MIERTGPQDKPSPRPADYAQKHPIRNALDIADALIYAAGILLFVIAVIWTLII